VWVERRIVHKDPVRIAQ